MPPKYWYEECHEFTVQQNFRGCENDSCTYDFTGGSNCVYIVIDVDDLFITSSNASLVNGIDALIKNLRVKYLGLIQQRTESVYMCPLWVVFCSLCFYKDHEVSPSFRKIEIALVSNLHSVSWEYLELPIER